MIDFTALLAGAGLIFSWKLILIILLGVAFGVICGAIPGFSASMSIAILLPATYGMDPLSAMTLLCCVYAGAAYGGSITAILLNAPGTPEAAATAFDGYELTKQGKANEALGLAIGASTVGGTVSYFLMLIALYPIAAFAIKFGSPEFFLLAVFGLTIIASLREESFAKCILAGAFGLLISTMGISPTGAMRVTFGITDLVDGIPVIPSVIGFFAFSELFYMINKEFITKERYERKTKNNVWEILKGAVKIFKYPKNLFRSSMIGTYVGALPAAGATVAAFLSYYQAKQNSKHPEKFGKGESEGIVAAETANNAATGGALTTTFALGIPGSSSTALILGALMLHGLQPGPRLFLNQMDLVYGLILTLFLSQIALFIAGVTASATMSGVLNISTKVLVPVIAVLCVVGSYSLHNNIFDSILMFIFGILGWIMKEHGYPPIATVLGIILGPMADSELIRTSLMFNGDFSIFFKRPISLGMIIFMVIVIIYPIIKKKRKEKNIAI